MSDLNKKRIVLAGNPNVGKSTVFNALTGMRQHTGNWTGKTVCSAVGRFTYGDTEFELIDVPGTYSLIPSSADEEVARAVICGQSDAVCVVADATAIERNLCLVLEILEKTDRVVVCVNLLDEARKKKIKVDLDELSLWLGVPVVGTAARSKKGLRELCSAIDEVSSGRQKTFVRQGGNIYERAAEIAEKTVKIENEDYARKDRLVDRFLTSKMTGVPVMLFLVAIVLWLTIVGANYPSQLLFSLFDRLSLLLTQIIPSGIFAEIFINGVCRTLFWVVAVMLPPMAIFFPMFTLLEDVGYLPRAAFNLDSCFRRAGAHGKQALTMCMGFGCNACGVTGCRIIDSPREKIIAIVTNNFVPCNGRFPTLIAIITMFFVASGFGKTAVLLGFIVLGVLMTIGVSWLLSKTFLKGEASSFALELPPYRVPKIGSVIVRSMLDRTLFVLGRAVAVAAPAGLIIWAFANIPLGAGSLLSAVTGILDPFARFFGLDGVILCAFLLGFPANEIVFPVMLMAYLSTGMLTDTGEISVLHTLLTQNGWTVCTAVCTALFTLFHFPCATTMLTIAKETRSRKYTLLAFALPTVVGLVSCFLVKNIFMLFGIS